MVRTCVARDAPASILLAASDGIDQESALGESNCLSQTVRFMVVMVMPNSAVIVDTPAECACIRVLLADETYTTPGCEDAKLVYPVTTCDVESER
eukprot:819351-Prymnesium_polylepis.2